MGIGINGMGRIGRLVLRDYLKGVDRYIKPVKKNSLPIKHINDPYFDASTLSHLIEYDSIHGKWNTPILLKDENKISIKSNNISISYKKLPQEIDWGQLGCKIVLDCTGKFLTKEKVNGYFEKGVKKVIVSAPISDPKILNIVMGVNEGKYDSKLHDIITAASCTTNCLAPIVKVINKEFGILRGQITTLHNPTNTNVVIDKYHKDLRRARSSLISMQPTSTGSAKAIGLIFPELNGKLNGHAVRIPVINTSLTDCVFQLKRKTDIKEVNSLFYEASENSLKGILGIEKKPLVSIDFVNDSRSSIVDAQSTMITDETLLKIYAWYDNEISYSCRMIDIVNYITDFGANV